MNMIKFNCKNLISKEYLTHRLILIAIFAVLAFGYILTFMPRTTFEPLGSFTTRSEASEVLKGDSLTQQIIVKDGVLKGIGIDFNTYFRRNVAEYTVDFLDKDKNLLFSNVFNADKLPHEEIYTMPLPNISVKQGEPYFIKITTSEATPYNALGAFLVDNASLPNAQLNGKELSGTLNITLGYESFSVSMLCITAFFVLAISLALLFFRKNMHTNVLVFVIILGVFFALFTPILDTPDETEHLAKPLHMLNGGFITSAAQGGSYLSNSFFDINANFGNTILDNTLGNTSYSLQSTKQLWGSGQFFFGYLPQTAGLAIGQLFNVNLLTMFYMGRIFNVLIYAIFAWLAVKTAPKFKLFLAVLSIMPMALIISSSYNSDGLIYGLCLLLGGFLIDLIYNRTYKIDFKKILIFSIIMSLIVMKKYSLVPFVLLFLCIPTERFASKKTKYIGFLFGVAFTMAVMFLLFYINVALNMDAGDAQTSALAPGGVNHRGASMYGQLGFILANPAVAYSVFTKTIMGTFGEYMLQTFTLGWLTYDVYTVFSVTYFAFMALVAFSYSRYEHEELSTYTVMSLPNRFGVVVVMAGVVLITYLMLYLSWTAVGGATIEGVQGRYFVPMLFMLPLLGQNVFPKVGKEAYMRSQINVFFVGILFASVTLFTVLTHNY